MSTPDGQAPIADLSTDPEPKGADWRSLLREIAETVVLALVLFMLIRIPIQNFRVDGLSMEPNFHDGQFLVINKLAYRLGEPHRGDVIVFHYPRDPERDFIKRVIGLPGETVEVREGQIYVDGNPSPELASVMPASFTSRPVTLGPDQLYVLGDNRPSSQDSQEWGPLSLDLVIGKVLLSYWPPESWGVVTLANAGDTQGTTPVRQ